MFTRTSPIREYYVQNRYELDNDTKFRHFTLFVSIVWLHLNGVCQMSSLKQPSVVIAQVSNVHTKRFSLQLLRLNSPEFCFQFYSNQCTVAPIKITIEKCDAEF